MVIFVRTCGERTTSECVRLASLQGEVVKIETTPFAESIRQTFLAALDLKNQKWIPVIDADVCLRGGTIKQAIAELEQKTDLCFCLDGKTNDKILMQNRRAGVHIYRREMIEEALQFINRNQLKPESHVRRQMTKRGYCSHTGKIVFGIHDYHQYYRDLWRKAFLQTRKLAGMIKKKSSKWKMLSKSDYDYKVIFAAHVAGKNYSGNMYIDKNMDFDAEREVKKLGLQEKEPLDSGSISI